MRPGSTTIRKVLCEIDAAVERKAAIIIEVQIKSLVISRNIDDPYIPCLDKVINDQEMLLVWRDFDVMGADGRLFLIRVIESLDIVQVANIQRRNVIGGGQG